MARACVRGAVAGTTAERVATVGELGLVVLIAVMTHIVRRRRDHVIGPRWGCSRTTVVGTTARE